MDPRTWADPFNHKFPPTQTPIFPTVLFVSLLGDMSSYEDTKSLVVATMQSEKKKYVENLD
jgi:hypothetical protein